MGIEIKYPELISCAYHDDYGCRQRGCKILEGEHSLSPKTLAKNYRRDIFAVNSSVGMKA